MAKKGPRSLINIKCQECGKIGYQTEKNRTHTTGKLVLNKFCSKCRKHTKHVESKTK